MDEPTESPEPKKLVTVKSLKTYVFEFFMIAAAVFMGFVAENFREVQAEKKLADELAHQFYDELLADSVVVQLHLDGRARMDTALRELVNYVRDSSLTKVGPSFVKNLYAGMLYSYRFQPTDVVLQQLKSSGLLRHFKSKELQKLTRNLGSVISQINARTAIEIEFGQNHVVPFNIQHLDQEYIVRVGFGTRSLAEVYQNIDSEKAPFYMVNLEEFKRKEVINMILTYRNMIVSGVNRYNAYKHLNAQLLAQLRSEYDIEVSPK